ncbi:MAG: hypothetical protein ACLRH1_12150 [Acutalibacteraceae bacterium]
MKKYFQTNLSLQSKTKKGQKADTFVSHPLPGERPMKKNKRAADKTLSAARHIRKFVQETKAKARASLALRLPDEIQTCL